MRKKKATYCKIYTYAPELRYNNYLRRPLKLTLLGTGTPTPLAHRAGSGFLVEFDEEVLLFDCGPGVARRLLEKAVPAPALTRLFLTHLHYDHCVDYACIVLTRWDQGAGKIPELDVFGPAPLKRMTERLFGSDGAFGPDLDARTQHPGSEFVYERRGGVLPRERPEPLVTEVADGSCIQGGNWRVETAEVVHVQPQLTCLAYRLDTPYGAIVFGGDTAPTRGLTELARDADLLIHMCHFINDVELDPRITGCCSGHLDAARTASEAAVGTLILTHVTEQLEPPGVRERLVAEAARIFSGHIVFAEDLTEVPVGHIDPEPIR